MQVVDATAQDARPIVTDPERPAAEPAPRRFEVAVTLAEQVRVVTGIEGNSAESEAVVTTDTLADTLARLKRAHPTHTRVALEAARTVPDSDVVAAMDAGRGTPEAPLFPAVQFADVVP